MAVHLTRSDCEGFLRSAVSNTVDGTDDDMFWNDTGDMKGQKCSVGGNCLLSLFLINLYGLETHCAESKD
jgi:hypothetical protein